MAPVVPVLSWTAWRISATPVRPEPPGPGHQGFSQAEHREVRLAVHPALPLFCVNCPQPCGLPHFHQWVSIAGTHTFPFHLIYIFLWRALSVSGFWAVALCLCFPPSSSSSCSGSAQSGRLRDSSTLGLGMEASQKWWEPISEKSMQQRYHCLWSGIFRGGITSE